MSDDNHPRSLTVSSESPCRIDRYIADVSKDWAPDERISRTQLQKLIVEGGIRLNGRIVKKPSEQVEAGDTVDLLLNVSVPSASIPATPFNLEILYEDDQVVVINKPSGISMHPGAGSQSVTVAGSLVHHIGASIEKVGGVGRPGIVHRLDKDTTGVVVAAKTGAAHAFLAAQFEKRSVGRAYIALVFSTPRATRLVRKQDSGEIDTLIGRNPVHRKEMAVVENGGRRAVTRWEVIERMSYGTLLSVRLKTGRTHQIRVHLNYIGSPVVGDPVYGEFSGLPENLSKAALKFGRQALHAEYLAFVHPGTGERMEFRAPLPRDFEALLGVFRGEG